MLRVLMLDDHNIDIFSSPESLCSHIEHPSFNGTEEAFLENGARVSLFLEKSTSLKDFFMLILR
jgi:hypothetical protein